MHEAGSSLQVNIVLHWDGCTILCSEMAAIPSSKRPRCWFTILTLLSILVTCVLYNIMWRHYPSQKWKYLDILNTSQEQASNKVETTMAVSKSTQTTVLRSDIPTVKPAWTIDPKSMEEVEKRLEKASKSSKKVIIIWFDISGGLFNFDKAVCGNCETTKNRSLINDPATAAIVFYYKQISHETMPRRSERNPNHLYVFRNLEPTPLMRYVHRKELNFEEEYGFNATMTYRRDSDFFNPYRNQWISASFKSKLKPEDILKMKKKTCISIISNCDWIAGSKLRLRMVMKIKSLGFPVDGFGRCFPDTGRFPMGDKEVVNRIREYKFYLAFENSYHCKDYITEKFYRNALFAGAVPIVLGPTRKDYEDAAPPGSFIFLEDFESLEKLIEYLNYLDRNDTAYLEYFRWRLTSVKESSPNTQRKQMYCHLCRSLHGINIDDTYNPRYNQSHPNVPLFTDGTTRRTVPSLKEYMFSEDEVCMEKNETLLPIYSKYKLFDL